MAAADLNLSLDLIWPKATAWEVHLVEDVGILCELPHKGLGYQFLFLGLFSFLHVMSSVFQGALEEQEGHVS